MEKYLVNNKKFLILNETHIDNCTCSYCNDSSTKKKLHYGLNIPKDKRGWWTIKYGNHKYLRIAMPFFK